MEMVFFVKRNMRIGAVKEPGRREIPQFSLRAKCPIEDENREFGRQFLMDKRGEGVPIILDESEKLSGKSPVYRLIDDTELMLTIFSAVMP
jgi:hypothetical protein